MATSRGTEALLVVESPAKALTLRRWLGPGWDVRATGGHLLDLPRNREGIDLANGFEPAWELIRGRGVEPTRARIGDSGGLTLRAGC